jgi:chloramphenicol 3-O-phosphotransferase
VLFLLFGSSCAGKTSALAALRARRLRDLVVHDFDEIGVPSDADVAWRRDANDVWLERALAYEAQGKDLVLAGQTPVGELLDSPSASRLERIAACLVDCDDATRLRRLRARALDPERRDDLIRWAAWLRRHADDARVRAIDTSALPVEEVADELQAWIERDRASR